MLNRRQLLAGVGGTAALVLGFDAMDKRWITAANAGEYQKFANLPRLDGVIVFDETARTANARDVGNIVHMTPAAVLRPGSVSDIAKMICYCRRYRIKVVARGVHGTDDVNDPMPLGGSFLGQGLVDGGLVIEMRWLNKIHSIEPGGAVVDAGLQWDNLVRAAYEQGLTPPSITGYTQITVGGTLSFGGFGAWSTNRAGSQADRTQWVEVVTGTGDVKRCSMAQNRDLFLAVLGGQGQCGVITRAKVDLVPAKQFARTYRIAYPETALGDTSTFFCDFRTLVNRGDFNHVINLPAPGTLTPFTIWATSFYDSDQPPNGAELLRGLSPQAQLAPATDLPYLDHIFLVDSIYDMYRDMLEWENRVKPWHTVFLPDSTVDGYVNDLLGTLSATDIGTTGFFLMLPDLRSSYTRPLVRVPDAEDGEWFWLVGVLTESNVPGADPVFANTMLARNHDLWQKAVTAGGTLDPEGATRLTTEEWRTHFGPVWTQFSRAKRRFDPDGILTPGPGIF